MAANQVEMIAIDVSENSETAETRGEPSKKNTSPPGSPILAPPPETLCIVRVPTVLRRQNPEAYTPDFVSIGPFHYRGKGVKVEGKKGKEVMKEGEEDWQLLERVKQSYLDEVLSTMRMTLTELTAQVIHLLGQNNDDKKAVFNDEEFEKLARRHYAEPLEHISSKDFIEMMIVDGCFLIQLFRKVKDQKLRDADDPIFNKDCMFQFLCHDILLLENQLPWFVIRSLYQLIVPGYKNDKERSLSILILNAFGILPSLKNRSESYTNYAADKKGDNFDADVLHILDLVRTSVIYPLRNAAETRKRKLETAHEEEDVFDPNLHQMHTATALSKAGIKFKPEARDSIRAIGLDRENKDFLMFPPLSVDTLSECLFRNMIAIEQCYTGYVNDVTSYVVFMDNLISSEEDLELLCKAKVIGSWVSNKEGFKFFNSLHKGIPLKDFYHAEECKQLNDWYTKWKLKQEKIGEKTRQLLIWFTNPWNAFSAIVGVLLLQVVPTLLQTTYTMKQYYTPPGAPQQ